MNRSIIRLLATIAVLMGAGQAQAHTVEFALGDLVFPARVPVAIPSFPHYTYARNGCKESNVSISKSSDFKQMSLLFNDFVLTTNHIKRCLVRIPLEVAEGLSVAVLKMDFRGFNALPERTRAQYKFHHAIRGPAGTPRWVDKFQPPQVFKQLFVGPLIEDFTISNLSSQDHLIWSPCGGKVMLRLYAEMRLSGSSSRSPASIALDSLDLSGEFGQTFHFVTKACR